MTNFHYDILSISKYIEFYIDGNLNGSFDCNGPNCTASYDWDTVIETEGEHTIQAILIDGWNNKTVLTPVTVIVDNIDQDNIHPTSIIISPASGAIVSGQVIIDDTFKTEGSSSPYPPWPS